FNSAETCKSKVDFPIPGSPPIKTRDPGTTPPPRTRLNSSKPVRTRPVCSTSTSFMVCAFETSFDKETRLLVYVSWGTFFSTNVFHLSQKGHFLKYFVDSYQISLYIIIDYFFFYYLFNFLFSLMYCKYF